VLAVVDCLSCRLSRSVFLAPNTLRPQQHS
jgi:hypothetical protein